jgi:hypothetical protein
VELLVLDDSILYDSQVLIGFLVNSTLLFFKAKLLTFVLHIFIFDLDYILLIVVDDAEELPLDFEKVLASFVFMKKGEFLLENEV